MARAHYDFGQIAPLDRARGASKIELAARLGYAAKGFVYATLGTLVLMAVFGFANGELTGTRGAIEAFNNQSWGPWILAAIAIGLLGFAIWRAVQAIKDTDDKGTDTTALVKRGGLLVSGAIYASLALYATKLFFDITSGGASANQRANSLMAQDGGQIAIALIGIGVIGVGLYQFYRVFRAKFRENWKTSQMSRRQEEIATKVSKFGIGARAVAFVLIGIFLLWGAATGQPDKAQGMGGMLSDVAQNPFGQWMVAIAGVGLICYGVYCVINALYRRIDAPDDAGQRHRQDQAAYRA